MLDWEEGSPLKAVPGPACRVIAPTAISPVQQQQARPFRDLSALFIHIVSIVSIATRAWLPIPDADLVGISAFGQRCIPVELSGPSLTDLACRTYVKHILRVGICRVSSAIFFTSLAQQTSRSAGGVPHALSLDPSCMASLRWLDTRRRLHL